MRDSKGWKKSEWSPDLGSFLFLSGDWNAIKDTTCMEARAGVVCWVLSEGLWFRCQKTTWLTSFNYVYVVHLCLTGCNWFVTQLQSSSSASNSQFTFSKVWLFLPFLLHVVKKGKRMHSSSVAKLFEFLLKFWENCMYKMQIILVLGEFNEKCIRNISKYQILLANFGIVENLSTFCKVEIHFETLEDMWDL